MAPRQGVVTVAAKEGEANQQLSLHACEERVRERLLRWQRERFSARLWQKDHRLWSETPLPELSDRLGWLALPEVMRGEIGGLRVFAEQAKSQTEHLVLLGMGGSSLAPEVFQRAFGNRKGYPELIVLDSTHPDAVASVEERMNLKRALFVVSSKSGTTTETQSLFRYFWQAVTLAGERPGPRFLAITDPATPLEKLAQERAFRGLFLAPPDVGGRYSALSVFGLLPAGLIGLDLERLVDRARTMVEACASGVAEADNPSMVLGAALGELALAGRDKVTFIPSPSAASFPSWVEQLIAESTGKEGRGIIPIVDEPPAPPEAYGRDRVFVRLRAEGEADAAEARLEALQRAGHPVIRIGLRDLYDLGGEFFRWEMAVAAAGAVLGVHPFNQPDVQLAKDLAARAMEERGGGLESGPAGDQETVHIGDEGRLREEVLGLLNGAREGDYVAIQAYLAPSPAVTEALQEIRVGIRNRFRLATSVAYGPRFLHSTGQLHKGGPGTGIFLQLTDEPERDLPVPETAYTFGALIRAQALGDYQALRQRGRRILWIHLRRDLLGGLALLREIARAG